jgi:hypothetical protein
MSGKTRLAVGLTICLAAALLMVTGVLDEKVGLVAGTLGMLMVATHSPSKTRETRQDRTT